MIIFMRYLMLIFYLKQFRLGIGVKDCELTELNYKMAHFLFLVDFVYFIYLILLQLILCKEQSEGKKLSVCECNVFEVPGRQMACLWR